MLDQLKMDVLEANRELVRSGLVTLTWGNVSGADRSQKFFVIKPSGVKYDDLTIADMVVIDFNGAVVEGSLRPSSDTPTHLILYQNFPSIGGITHTHSLYATMFAQACTELPCFGTTHADHFNGAVPVTRVLREDEVKEEYERNTGNVIIEKFRSIDPAGMPAVLVAGHGPFTWGHDAIDSVKNAIALEHVAHMAAGTLQLNSEATEIPDYILNKHYQRKHGPKAYYGQKK